LAKQQAELVAIPARREIVGAAMAEALAVAGLPDIPTIKKSIVQFIPDSNELEMIATTVSVVSFSAKTGVCLWVSGVFLSDGTANYFKFDKSRNRWSASIAGRSAGIIYGELFLL